MTQKNVFGKIRFLLTANGHDVGSLNAENWRAWNFNIQDANGTQVARRAHTGKVADALQRVVREEALVLERLKDA